MKKSSSKGIWHAIDMFQGDKIILMILFMLYVFSILAISSSTPLLAIQQHTTRFAIIKEQWLITIMGAVLVIAIYFICDKLGSIGLIRVLSEGGFLVSLFLLLCLAVKINLPGFKAVTINGAVRAIKIGPMQLHVSEFVKVFMVMYLAWAINAFHQHKFRIANILAQNPKYAFMAESRWQLLFYIFIPVMAVSLLLLVGSTSSCIFIGGIMLIIIIIGGIKAKDIIFFSAIAVVLLGLAVAISFGTKGKVFNRIYTAKSRIGQVAEDPETQLLTLEKNSNEFQKVLDENRQPISAKVAVSEGGFFGKGPGKSTQRYVVPVMFEDYIFSFIVEEYGIIGALLVMVLYASLLARGALLVKNCDNEFAKLAVAGLVLLIVGQAAMHMMINVDLGPLTGQTLPLISHGNSSFLAFSMAFGIILYISTLAKRKLDRETAKSSPIMVDPVPVETDDTKARLDALEDIDE